MDPGSFVPSFVPFLGLIISAVVVGIMAVVMLIVAVVLHRSGVFTQLGRAMAAGSPMPRQAEVERSGQMGQATVLDCNELESVAKNRTMVYHMAALVLEVRLQGLAPYRAPCRQWFIGSKWFHISQGSVVPVRVDSRDPQLVFVDFLAMDQQRENAERADREAHARRQAELLANRR